MTGDIHSNSITFLDRRLFAMIYTDQAIRWKVSCTTLCMQWKTL